VQEPSDYLLVPLLTVLGFIVSGVWSLYLVKKEFNVNFVWQTMATLKFQLVEGWHVFFSSMAISLYTISTTFILGLFANNTVVGYFAAADKIVQAVKGVYAPVSQAIYPLISKKIHEDKEIGLAFIHKTTWIVGLSMFFMSAILFLFAKPIVMLLLGEQFHQSVLLLQIMAFLPFIIALSNIYGIQTMLNLGYKKDFSYILLSAAVLGVSLSMVLVPLYSAEGTAFTLLVVEIFVTIIMYGVVKFKYEKNYTC
jgi:PST family polysaccharide transporter